MHRCFINNSEKNHIWKYYILHILFSLLISYTIIEFNYFENNIE